MKHKSSGKGIMEGEYQKQLERFLNPQVMRQNIITASLFIASYEILKDCIIRRINNFYCTGLESKDEDINCRLYETEVRSRHKKILIASLLWLKENGIITENDKRKFDKLTEIRNLFAHEIHKVLADGLPTDLPEYFLQLISLLSKIEKWWIVNVDIPVNPEWDAKEIDEDGIFPGSVAYIKILMDIALGTEEEAGVYLRKLLNTE